MKGHGKYETIGETRDDAAGEAFDKAAKLMKLNYPGGPAIAFEAEKFIKQSSKISNFKFLISKQIPNPKSQIPKKIYLPRPMINSKSYDFSFSGLKTALMYKLKKDKNWRDRIPEYSAEFQQAIIDVLIHKTIKAAKEYKVKTVMLTGGVAANKELRRQMQEVVTKQLPNSQFLIPDLKYTTDNAVMMAVAGYYKAKRKKFTAWQKLKVDCNLEL
jgi:N6-L-threonylcarbamoyladenine synthase